MIPLTPTELLGAAPFADLLEMARRDLQEAIDLAPDSAIRLERARFVARLEAAVERARSESPTTDSSGAAEIMGVTPRRATQLAEAREVRAWQKKKGGTWTFDVRSCHARVERVA